MLGYDTITVQHAWELSSGVQKAVNLDDLFARSDVVTVHVPLNKDTDKLVSAARLHSMPRDGVILNFSRGEIVDGAAVLAALDAGKLKSYVTDFPTRGLRDPPKVICLPHLGASTVEAEENCAVMVADNVREFLENGNADAPVNFPETVLQHAAHRIAIPHANVPNMVAQILTAIAAEHQHRGHAGTARRASYTLVDRCGATWMLARIRKIEGIPRRACCRSSSREGGAAKRPVAKPMSKRKPSASKAKTPRAKKGKRPEAQPDGEAALQRLRGTIDEIDANIQQLIAARARCAKEIGVLKGLTSTADPRRTSQRLLSSGGRLLAEPAGVDPPACRTRGAAP